MKVIRSKLDVLNTSVKAFVDLVGITFLMYAISGLSVLVRTTFTSFRKPANRQSSSKESGSRVAVLSKMLQKGVCFLK